MAKVSRADREKRLDRTTQLLAFHTYDDVVRKLSSQFKVSSATAKKWIAAVNKRILAAIQKPREEWVADTLHQLNEIIRTNKDERLEALKQRTALLGLNAPKQLKLSMEGLYRGPQDWEALRNPELLAKVMEVEVLHGRLRMSQANGGNEPSNGGGTQERTPRVAAEQLRLFGLPAVSVSSTPPDTTEGGIEFVVPGRSPPADRPNAGQTR